MKRGITKEMCDEGMDIEEIMRDYDGVRAKHVADGGKMAKDF